MSLHIGFRHRLGACGFDVAIDAPTPGIVALFGPSGAGKSTIAAVAAGLLRTPFAQVSVDGVVLTDTEQRRFVPPERRRIGTVFQDARLFAHLSVAGNLRYGLTRAPALHAIGWDEVIALLGIGGLLDRRPATLSGGERQRVAIGRALLSQPRLLIMDEPLAALDAPRRAEILPYLGRLRDTLSLPILYVTHALDEAARLADMLVLVEDGKIAAAGPLHRMLARADLSTAARGDAGAVLDCTIVEHLAARRLTRLAVHGTDQALLVPVQQAGVGQRLRVRIPAAEVILATREPHGISVQNVLAAMIHQIRIEGGIATVELRLGEAGLLARITPDAVDRLALKPGLPILALLKSMSVQVFD